MMRIMVIIIIFMTTTTKTTMLLKIIDTYQNAYLIGPCFCADYHSISYDFSNLRRSKFEDLSA